MDLFIAPNPRTLWTHCRMFSQLSDYSVLWTSFIWRMLSALSWGLGSEKFPLHWTFWDLLNRNCYRGKDFDFSLKLGLVRWSPHFHIAWGCMHCWLLLLFLSYKCYLAALASLWWAQHTRGEQSNILLFESHLLEIQFRPKSSFIETWPPSERVKQWQ